MWDLRQEAKWGRDFETQKNAIQELGKIGAPALSVLQEVMAVSTRSNVRECCQDVINGIANVRTEPEKHEPEKKEVPQEKST